ncbi:MAG: PIN domain-containing protein [Pirellulales bacterium]|nr:PIN domain-containing protein [Pirellulales bacterium]
MRSGFAAGRREQSNETTLQRFLAKPHVGVLVPDDVTTLYYARIATALRKRGTPIPANDVWIAAQALQHSLTLDTRDEHFCKVPGLKLWRG